MKLLAIDTCFNTSSIALFDGDKVITTHSDKEAFNQASKLIVFIEDILKKNKVEYSELTAIAVTIGPGSFTGIRIGLSTVNAVSLVTNVPIVSLNTTEVIAYQVQKFSQKKYKKILVLINALRKQVYYQKFTVKKSGIGFFPSGEISTCDIKDIGALVEKDQLITGNCKKIVQEVIGNNEHITDDVLIDAKYLGFLAMEKMKEKQKTIPIANYIREPDAKLPAKKQKDDNGNEGK